VVIAHGVAGPHQLRGLGRGHRHRLRLHPADLWQLDDWRARREGVEHDRCGEKKVTTR
jgi:hypothetical protein